LACFASSACVFPFSLTPLAKQFLLISCCSAQGLFLLEESACSPASLGHAGVAFWAPIACVSSHHPLPYMVGWLSFSMHQPMSSLVSKARFYSPYILSD
jgi:hypothetical protein